MEEIENSEKAEHQGDHNEASAIKEEPIVNVAQHGRDGHSYWCNREETRHHASGQNNEAEW